MKTFSILLPPLSLCQDLRNVYECPVYKTKSRGPTFVWTFNLKSKEKPSKWVLGGVALLLQV